MKRTDYVRSLFIDTKYSPGKSDAFPGSCRPETRRKIDSYKTCGQTFSGLWNPMTRNRRDDTPPAAAVVV